MVITVNNGRRMKRRDGDGFEKQSVNDGVKQGNVGS